jgi:hypothetical protein
MGGNGDLFAPPVHVEHVIADAQRQDALVQLKPRGEKLEILPAGKWGRHVEPFHETRWGWSGGCERSIRKA